MKSLCRKLEGEVEQLTVRHKNADIQVEYSTMTGIALYKLLMSFLQKGIDMLCNLNEHL